MPNEILLLTDADRAMRRRLGVDGRGLFRENPIFIFANSALLAGVIALNWRFLFQFKQVRSRFALPCSLLALPPCYFVLAEDKRIRSSAQTHLKAMKDAA